MLSLGQCAFLLLFWIISSLLTTQQQQILSDFVLFSLGCGPKTDIWFEIGCDLQSQDARGRGKFFQQNQCGPTFWETSGKHHFYDTFLTFSAIFQCNTQQFSLEISWIIVWDQFNLSLFQKIKWNIQTLERIWYSVSFSWISTFDLKRKDLEPEIMLDISVTHEPMYHKFPLFRICKVSLRKWTLSEMNHQCSQKLVGMVIFQELHILQYWSIYRYFHSEVWDLHFDMIWQFEFNFQMSSGPPASSAKLRTRKVFLTIKVQKWWKPVWWFIYIL